MSDDPDLDALFDSVAGRERIDWEHVEARSATREQRARLKALRDVAKVAEFHQTLQRDHGTSGEHKAIERWGDLLLLEKVGAGAAGDVYRAWDATLQREVALKLMRRRDGEPTDATDWLEEARALARVRDPHAVTVFGAAEHDGRAGLWMEFVRGATLEVEIQRRGALPADVVARLGVQLGRALASVHAAGALHRDVKPGNILVEPDGRAVLTDFGLGRRRGPSSDAAAFSGTPMFMSPQRLSGASARPTDDLYALGVTLRWALTGKPPFEASGLADLRAAAAAGPARRLSAERPDAPASLVAAIDRAMAIDPNARFASGTELARAFEVSTSSSPTAKRGAFPSWTIAAGVIALVAAASWIVAQRASHPAAAPPPPAVTPASEDYDVAASFLRRGKNGDQRLESGDRVAPGDQLSLEFRATRPVWLYVLDADDRGECYVLFPQPIFDRTNPLPRDSTVILPGTRDGHENGWTVTSRGGREHLLVMASPEPDAALEAELSRVPAATPGHPVSTTRLEPATVEHLRGIGGVSEVPARPAPVGPSGVFDRVKSLAGREQGVHGAWVRQIVLANPMR